MKIFIFIALTLIALSQNIPEARSSRLKAPISLPLDISITESQTLWRNFLKNDLKNEDEIDEEILKSIHGGEKLLSWIKKINSSRNPQDQIKLSDPNSRGEGIPIEKPFIYGPTQIKEDYINLISAMPTDMKNVVYGDLPISNKIPVDKETFISWGKKTSKLYQTAVRWVTAIKPWMSYYKARKASDVRGYYYLDKEENLNEKLEDFLNLDRELKEKIEKWLINICLNNKRSIDTCERHFRNLMTTGKLIEFRDTYWKEAKENYENFFKIVNPRDDVEWRASSEDTMNIIFLEPNDQSIKDWLQTNIEDEFKLGNWNLKMNFTSRRRKEISEIKFRPNTTPHVESGNIIVMDQNQPLDEFSVKWTIRHEYGHILRLPDCYVEFYDEEIESVVNYQIDVTDLMCSRAGNFNQRIYDELKRVYFRAE